MGKKTLLKSGPPVSREHFSSGQAPSAVAAHRDTTRCVVRVLEAADLLASDAITGKSDPVCFMWIGHRATSPVFDRVDPVSGRLLGPGEGVLTTAVVPTTINPVWNSDHIFLLGPEVDAASMMLYKLSILVRDEDVEEDGKDVTAAVPPSPAAPPSEAPAAPADNNNDSSAVADTENKPAANAESENSKNDDGGGLVSYDPLGCADISFKDIFRQGKKVNGSAIILGPVWKTLQKHDGMRRVEGRIKLSVSIIFSDNDLELMRRSLGLSEDAKAGEIIDALQRRVDPARPLSAGASSASLLSRSSSPSGGRPRRSPSPGQGRGSAASVCSAASVSPIRPRSAGYRGSMASSSQRSIDADSALDLCSQSDVGSAADYDDLAGPPQQQDPIRSDLSAIAENEADETGDSLSRQRDVLPSDDNINIEDGAELLQDRASSVVRKESDVGVLLPLLDGGNESTPPDFDPMSAISPLESPLMERQASKEAMKSRSSAGKTAADDRDGRKGHRSGSGRRENKEENDMLNQLREQLVLATNTAQKTEQTLRELEVLKSQLQPPAEDATKAKASKISKKLKEEAQRADAKQRLKESLRQHPAIGILSSDGPGDEEFDEEAGVVVRSKGRSVALVVGEEPPKNMALAMGLSKQEAEVSAALSGTETDAELLVLPGGGDEVLPPDFHSDTQLASTNLTNPGNIQTYPHRPSKGTLASSQDSDTVLRYPYRKEKKSRGADETVKQLEELKKSTNYTVDRLMYELSPGKGSSSSSSRGATTSTDNKGRDASLKGSSRVRFDDISVPGKAALNKTAPGALQSASLGSKTNIEATTTAAPVPSVTAEDSMQQQIGRVRRSEALDWEKITEHISKYLEDTRASLSSSTWSSPAPGAAPTPGSSRPPAPRAPRLPAYVVQDVLQFGFPDDVARLAQLVAIPVPEQLSTSHRNLMYESLAYLLASDECKGQYDAIVMPWLMALVQFRLVPSLTRRVQQVLVGALRQVAGQRSEVGVWASRLEAAISTHGV